jgi:HSP20 family protein
MAFPRPWIPFREIGELRRNIDDILEHLRDKIDYPLGAGSAQKPPLESFVEEGKLIVRAELPGIDPKDITVNVVGNMLTIRATRQEEHETRRRDFLHREFRYGVLERSMTLPQGVKAEDIKANFSNGLLQLAIPNSLRKACPRKLRFTSSMPNRNLRVGRRRERLISDPAPVFRHHAKRQSRRRLETPAARRATSASLT